MDTQTDRLTIKYTFLSIPQLTKSILLHKQTKTQMDRQKDTQTDRLTIKYTLPSISQLTKLILLHTLDTKTEIQTDRHTDRLIIRYTFHSISKLTKSILYTDRQKHRQTHRQAYSNNFYKIILLSLHRVAQTYNVESRLMEKSL
jgi:hypothetical protein